MAWRWKDSLLLTSRARKLVEGHPARAGEGGVCCRSLHCVLQVVSEVDRRHAAAQFAREHVALAGSISQW